MRPSNIKTFQYRDKLKEQKRRSLLFKVIGVIALGAVICAAIIFILFFSPFFKIKSINADGVDDAYRQRLVDKATQKMVSGKLGFIETQRNIFFFDKEALLADLRAEFTSLERISIEKKYPHELILKASERKPYGIWCFATSECKYFDEDGATWGNAAKSSGFLLLVVTDQREAENYQLDQDYFKAIKQIHKNLGELSIRQAIIKSGDLREFNVEAAQGYPIIFSLDADIENQIAVLKIFMADKSRRANFVPQYLDLRIDGRVYYK